MNFLAVFKENSIEPNVYKIVIVNNNLNLNNLVYFKSLKKYLPTLYETLNKEFRREKENFYIVPDIYKLFNLLDKIINTEISNIINIIQISDKDFINIENVSFYCINKRIPNYYLSSTLSVKYNSENPIILVDTLNNVKYLNFEYSTYYDSKSKLLHFVVDKDKKDYFINSFFTNYNIYFLNK